MDILSQNLSTGMTLVQLPHLRRRHLLTVCNDLSSCRDGELTTCQGTCPATGHIQLLMPSLNLLGVIPLGPS